MPGSLKHEVPNVIAFCSQDVAMDPWVAKWISPLKHWIESFMYGPEVYLFQFPSLLPPHFLLDYWVIVRIKEERIFFSLFSSHGPDWMWKYSGCWEGQCKKQFSFSHVLAMIIKAARGNVNAIGLSPQYYIAFSFSSDFSLFFSDELGDTLSIYPTPKYFPHQMQFFFLFFPFFAI